jgi:hypothetical protein
LRTETYATTDAIRSTLEWIASVMIAIEPVIAPAAILSAIRVAFEMIETVAARAFGGACAAGPIAPAAAASRPRGLTARLRSARAAPVPRGRGG